MRVSKELQKKYDQQYSDKSEEWRAIGARGKAQNIIDVCKDHKFEKVLEVGAGDGNILSVLSSKKFATSYSASEISSSAVEQIKKKNIEGLHEVKQTEGYTLPFEDNEFDLSICSHVIEHLEFPRALLRELKRVSKMQIMEIPIDFSFKVDQKFDHYYAYGHINIYTPAMFRFLLLSEKFTIVNDKCAFYPTEVSEFQYKDNFMMRLRLSMKRLVWSLIPSLMKIKPNTYTVLTS